MDCQRAAQIIFLHVDDEIDEDLRDPFEEHLDGCPHCKQRAVFFAKLLIVFRQRCTRHSAPSGLRQRILTSFPHRGPSQIQNR